MFYNVMMIKGVLQMFCIYYHKFDVLLLVSKLEPRHDLVVLEHVIGPLYHLQLIKLHIHILFYLNYFEALQEMGIAAIFGFIQRHRTWELHEIAWFFTPQPGLQWTELVRSCLASYDKHPPTSSNRVEVHDLF